MIQRSPRGIPLDGARVRELRQALACTQEELAARSACDEKTVRKAERSELLDLATIRRLALALGVEPADLMLTESRAAGIRAVQDYVEAFNQRDPDAVAAAFHDEGSVNVMTDPGLPGGGLFCRKEGVREWARICMDAMHMEPVSLEMFRIDVSGEYVMMRSITDIRVEAPRTRRAVRAAVASEFRVRDGKILTLRIFSDTLAISRLHDTADGDD